MAIILDWKIRATQAQCELKGEAFADGQEFYTCIFDDPESDGFIRRDYAIESWEKVQSKIDPPPFSFWKSTYKAPVVETDKKKIDESSVEGMLRRFTEEDDPKTENARYILVLMLERKKKLIPTDVQEAESRKLLFYEHEESGEVFIVGDPGLKLDEIETVQMEVAELLAAEERGISGEASSDDETEGETKGESTEDDGAETAEKSEVAAPLENSEEEATEQEKGDAEEDCEGT
jgi:hypothetical protein